MEVKNGIIIDGVLHDYIISSTCDCASCSIKKECDELPVRNLSLPCDIFRDGNGKIFVNRGKVKVEQYE